MFCFRERQLTDLVEQYRTGQKGLAQAYDQIRDRMARPIHPGERIVSKDWELLVLQWDRLHSRHETIFALLIKGTII
jgi:uncharacterized protein YbgA (DUF1722 family)